MQTPSKPVRKPMHPKDRLFFISIIVIVGIMIILIAVGIIQANKEIAKSDMIVQSTPQKQIVLPLSDPNITAQTACSQFKSQPWDTPAYGSLERNGTGINQSVDVYCKNGSKSLELEYVRSLAIG